MAVNSGLAKIFREEYHKDMTPRSYTYTLYTLTFLGFLFSGYLSAVKFITTSCFLNEPCPYFLGYPACWFGFGFFTLLLISALVGGMKSELLRTSAKVQAVVSLLGTVFATYFTVPEIIHLINGEKTFALGLPTCAYGLVFFISIFSIATRYVFQTQVKKVE